MLIPIKTYLSNLTSALNSEGAHLLYFPPGKEERKAGNLRLARELAYGLKDYSPQEIDSELKTLYGSMLVKHSLDQTGVVLDAKEWLGAIRARLAELAAG